MRLRHLKLFNFRNYANLDVTTDKKVVVLVGDNAQGKTNFLEAIYILALTRSFRLRSDAGLIGEQENFSRVEAEGHGLGRDFKIEVVLKVAKGRERVQKIIKLDSRLASVREILGAFLAVLFCPEDINLIRAVPGARRRFLDIVACKVSHIYCQKLMEYNKILRHRNQVLIRIKKNIGKREELIFWNNELTDKGSFIIQFRQKMLQSLAALTKNYYAKIVSGEKKELWPELNLHYLPSFHIAADSAEEGLRLRFRGELLEKEGTEIFRGQTLFGPHRDDFHFILGHKNIISQGSRGQFRLAVLALKMAELEFLKTELGERPVLLLDDVFSELDAKRKTKVANLVRGQQTFITTTDLSEIAPDLRKDALILEVVRGKIETPPTRGVNGL